MPTVSVRQDDLFKQVGRSFTSKEFDELCFEFGIELDCEEVLEGGVQALRIEVPANRYDLLCREGIGTALGVFLGNIPMPILRLNPPQPQQRLLVKKSTSEVRPFAVAAILRNLTFTEASYASFIDLQEKLHQNICRRRCLASVGTHDLDTVEGPFTYEAIPSEELRFVPLYQTKEVDGDGMVQLLEGHQQLKQYLHLVRDAPLYPAILDGKRRVCSAPPIINSEFSKITLDTKNVLIEVTATDRTKASIVLNMIIASFSMHCNPAFEIEPLLVEYEEGHRQLGGKKLVCPDLSSRSVEFTLEYVRSIVGVPSLSASEVCRLLERMMIPTEIVDDASGEQSRLRASVPVTRSDILHPCDLAEDVAIAYGYNKIPVHEFSSVNEQPINALTDQLRREAVTSGYFECQNWALLSLKEAYDFLRRAQPCPNAAAPINKKEEYTLTPIPARIGNPKTREFEMVRTSLLPGLLKSLYANQHMALPIRLFEIGDCVQMDHDNPQLSRNHRNCAVLYCNNTNSGLEDVHGLLDLLLNRLQLSAVYDQLSTSARAVSKGVGSLRSSRTFRLEPCTDGAFLPGRCVRVVVDPEAVVLGVMGVVHPDVLKNFNIPLPAAVFEFTLQPFLDWLPETDILDY